MTAQRKGGEMERLLFLMPPLHRIPSYLGDLNLLVCHPWHGFSLARGLPTAKLLNQAGVFRLRQDF
jgi:hypothetical protein